MPHISQTIAMIVDTILSFVLPKAPVKIAPIIRDISQGMKVVRLNTRSTGLSPLTKLHLSAKQVYLDWAELQFRLL